MKKTVKYAGLFLLLLATGISLNAKNKGTMLNFGIKGGLNIHSSSYPEQDLKFNTAYNAGVALQILPPVKGLAIQPELLFASRGTSLTRKTTAVRTNFLELPIDIQYGFDLIFFRPFISLTPYAGCSVYNYWAGGKDGHPSPLPDVNRFQYGIGVGAGFDLWKFQFSFKYKWGLCPFYKNADNVRYQGADLSIAIFF